MRALAAALESRLLIIVPHIPKPQRVRRFHVLKTVVFHGIPAVVARIEQLRHDAPERNHAVPDHRAAQIVAAQRLYQPPPGESARPSLNR